MKSSTKNMMIISLAAVISSLLFSSCSLIGFGIGSAVDKKTPGSVNITLDHIDTLELEKRVEVIQNNGDTIYGRYNGLIPIYSHDFHSKYDSIQIELADKVKLPDLDDTLLISYNDDNALKKIGLFKGFESRKLWCKYTYGNMHFQISLDSIENITINNEYEIDSVQIKEIITEKTFPDFIHVDINLGMDNRNRIEIASINKVLIIDKRNRKFIGLGVGLAIDAIIAVLIINSSFDPPAPTSF